MPVLRCVPDKRNKTTFRTYLGKEVIATFAGVPKDRKTFTGDFDLDQFSEFRVWKGNANFNDPPTWSFLVSDYENAGEAMAAAMQKNLDIARGKT